VNTYKFEGNTVQKSVEIHHTGVSNHQKETASKQKLATQKLT